MTRAGCPTGKGISIRVYEVTVRGERRDLAEIESHGWAPIAVPDKQPGQR